MKMVVFKILALFVVTITLFGRTTTSLQFQRVNLDADAIKVTPIDRHLYKGGRMVDFGALGVRQVVITYRNQTKNEGYITLYVVEDDDTKKEIADINVYAAIPVDENKFEVTEMVETESGSWKVFASVSTYTYKEYILASGDEVGKFNIESISFIPKKLDRENPYRIISTSNKLGITIKSRDKHKNKTIPMLYTSICEDRQSFYFEPNELGHEYRIINKGTTKNDVKYLEIRDGSTPIGDNVILVKQRGSKYNVWSLLPGERKGVVKIQSQVTGNCISAIHGFGSNLVMVDCYNGRANEWYLKLCDG